MVNTNRGALKYYVFSILTLGIYSIYFYYHLNRDMNLIQKKRKDYQANYVAIFILGLITFGLVPLVWKTVLTVRIYDEAKKRSVRREGNYIWVPIALFVLGWTFVCPIVAQSQLCETMNNVAEDYNEKALEEYNLQEAKLFYLNGRAIPKSRIIERHNLGSVFTGFLLLLIGMIPIITMIVPLFYMSQKVTGEPAFTSQAFVGIIDIIISLFNHKATLAVTLTKDFQFFTDTTGNIVYNIVYLENIIAIFVWFLLSLALGLGCVVIGAIIIIRGRLSFHFTPIIVTAAMFLNLLILTIAVGRLGWFYTFSLGETVKALGIAKPTTYIFLPIPAVAMIVSLLLAAAILFIYLFYFVGRTYRDDLDYVEMSDEDSLEEQLQQKKSEAKRKAQPAKKVANKPTTKPVAKAEPKKVKITAIKDHAYAKNTDIKELVINNGIKEVGPSAFANCLRIETISLPKSIEKLEYNCFFNCASLKEIKYDGTKEEWSKIERGSNWLTKAGTKTVICADGAITVDPTC